MEVGLKRPWLNLGQRIQRQVALLDIGPNPVSRGNFRTWAHLDDVPMLAGSKVIGQGGVLGRLELIPLGVTPAVRIAFLDDLISASDSDNLGRAPSALEILDFLAHGGTASQSDDTGAKRCRQPERPACHLR